MDRRELDLLGAMLDDAVAWHYSLEIGAAAGIAAGTIYPVLAKLERAGWLESRWDKSGSKDVPRRRLYRLTGVGQRCAVAALAEHGASRPASTRRPRGRFGFGLRLPGVETS